MIIVALGLAVVAMIATQGTILPGPVDTFIAIVCWILAIGAVYSQSRISR